MQKRRPGEGGADLQSGDRRNPTATRVRIQANRAMALRLEALKFGTWWRPRFNAESDGGNASPATDAGGPA